MSLYIINKVSLPRFAPSKIKANATLHTEEKTAPQCNLKKKKIKQLDKLNYKN